MFAHDRSADAPLSTFLADVDNAWRARVRRFRRGWTRIGQGLALIVRGVGDIVAGLPAVAVVACALLLVWLARNVTLVRIGLSWVLNAHRNFVAVLRALARAALAAWKPVGIGLALFFLVLLVSPALDAAGALMAAIAAHLPNLTLPELPPPPQLPDVDVREAGHRLAAFLDRSVYVLVVVAVVVAIVLGGAMVLAYAAFAAYVAARAVGLGAAALFRVIVHALENAAFRLTSVLSTVGAGAARAAAFIRRAVVWLLRGIYLIAARAVTAVVDGAADGVRFILFGLARLAAGLVFGVWRFLRNVALGSANLVLALVRLIRDAFNTLFGAATGAARRTSAGATWAAGSLRRAVVRFLRRLAAAVWWCARFVWAHVFRLFALTGTIAAATFTVWAVRSMREGRPIPTSLAELAASTVYAAAALLAAFSTFAILAAVALAIRHAPPKLVRLAGLAALVLLASVPVPFLMRALWNSAPVAAARDAAPGVLAALRDAAPAILATAAGAALLALTASALVWLARRLTPAVRRAAARGALAVGGAAVLVVAARWMWNAAPKQDIAAGAHATLATAADAAPAVMSAVAFAAVALAAAAFALWAYARTPTRAKRAAALAALALAALVATGYGAALGWRRVDPPARVAGLAADAGAWWSDWRARQAERREIRRARLEAERRAAVERERRAAETASRADVETAAPAVFVAALEPGRPAGSRVDPAAGLHARRVFPEERPMHWRFGDAARLGDGLTAFKSVDDAVSSVDVCGAGALVAVGMASAEGPDAFNEDLAQCRADRLAARLSADADACAAAGAPTVFTLNLGQAAAPTDSTADRRAYVFAVDDPDAVTADAVVGLDPVVAGHSGRWRLATFDRDARACAAVDD